MKKITIEEAKKIYGNSGEAQSEYGCIMLGYNTAVDKHNAKRDRKKRDKPKWQQIIETFNHLKLRVERLEKTPDTMLSDAVMKSLNDLTKRVDELQINFVPTNIRWEKQYKLNESINHDLILHADLISQIAQGCKEFEERIAALEASTIKDGDIIQNIFTAGSEGKIITKIKTGKIVDMKKPVGSIPCA